VEDLKVVSRAQVVVGHAQHQCVLRELHAHADRVPSAKAQVGPLEVDCPRGIRVQLHVLDTVKGRLTKAEGAAIPFIKPRGDRHREGAAVGPGERAERAGNPPSMLNSAPVT